MDDLDFLKLHGPGDATLMVILPEGGVCHIGNLNSAIIAHNCPILHLSFERSLTGGLTGSIETTSRELVVRFLRFIYLGTYMDIDIDRGEHTPGSLLIHTQLCHLGHIYNLLALEASAHANFMSDIEFSCSGPKPPIDLCAAIRFTYQHLTDKRTLVETLLNYCVYCFSYHGLGNNSEFRKTAYEVSAFHRDLCITNFQRGFADDGASDIVCLPVRSPTPHSLAGQNTLLSSVDYLLEVWSDAEEDVDTLNADGKRFRADKSTEIKRRRVAAREGGFTMVYRPKKNGEAYNQSETESSVDEGFTLVYRPKKRDENGRHQPIECNNSRKHDVMEKCKTSEDQTGVLIQDSCAKEAEKEFKTFEQVIPSGQGLQETSEDGDTNSSLADSFVTVRSLRPQFANRLSDPEPAGSSSVPHPHQEALPADDAGTKDTDIADDDDFFALYNNDQGDGSVPTLTPKLGISGQACESEHSDADASDSGWSML